MFFLWHGYLCVCVHVRVSGHCSFWIFLCFSYMCMFNIQLFAFHNLWVRFVCISVEGACAWVYVCVCVYLCIQCNRLLIVCLDCYFCIWQILPWLIANADISETVIIIGNVAVYISFRPNALEKCIYMRACDYDRSYPYPYHKLLGISRLKILICPTIYSQQDFIIFLRALL